MIDRFIICSKTSRLNGKNIFCLSLLVLFLGLVTPARAVYTVVDLGILTNLPSGERQATINAVSMTGKIIGITVSNGNFTSFIYGGSRTNIGTLGGDYCSAQVIGGPSGNVICGKSTMASGFEHAFRWVIGATNGVAGNPQMTDLGTLGGNNSSAYDINISGQIAGQSSLPGDIVYNACRFNTNGTITDIGALMPGAGGGGPQPQSIGWGINSLGHVVGTYTDPNGNSYQSFFYNGTNVFLLGDLTGFNGNPQSEAFAISSSRNITGYSINSNFEYHAFRWVTNAMTDLGTLGGTESSAWGINSNNVIVGLSKVAGDVVDHAFIASNNIMVDLNGLLDSSSNGWELIKAEYINDLGQIVGYGTNNGALHGYLLNAVAAGGIAPVITNQPVPLSVLGGSNATFSVLAGGSATLAYQWRFNTTNIPGASGSNYTVVNAQATNAGNYSVVITNSFGTITSSPAALTVNFPPTITNQPVPLSVLGGSNATFNVLAGGTATLAYQWRINGTNLTSATGTSYTVTNAQATNAGNYTVVITNNFGSITSSPAALAVNFPPSITGPPSSQTVLVGSNATFTVAATGTALLGYQWRFTNAISGAINNTLTITNAQLANAGSYTVIVTNLYGGITSTPAILNVVPIPLFTDIRMQGADVLVTFNTSTGATYQVENRTNPAAGSWLIAITNIAGTGSFRSVTHTNGAGAPLKLYRVRVTVP